MNRKGFTLVELLGVIVILSIVMLIAIPNITSTLERSKRQQYVNDAKKMISLVDYEIRKGEINKPAENKAIKITLAYLATNDLDKDADGVAYDLNESYVVVVRKNKELKYYVTLMAKHDNSFWGIRLKEKEELSGEEWYNLVDKNLTTYTEEEIRNNVGASTIQSY